MEDNNNDNINEVINNFNVNNHDNIISVNSKMENQDKNEKNYIEIEYIDDEINELSYDLATQYDKRNFCQYYISLVK